MKKNLKFILLSFFALLLFSCGTILLTHDFSVNNTEVGEESGAWTYSTLDRSKWNAFRQSYASSLLNVHKVEFIMEFGDTSGYNLGTKITANISGNVLKVIGKATAIKLPADLSYFFHYNYNGQNVFENVKEMNLDNFDTSAVSNMKAMFYGCSSLLSLDLSSFNTSQATDMQYMFSYCESLGVLTLSSSFTTNAVNYMKEMFAYCKSLTSVSLASFSMSRLGSYSDNIFYQCNNLQTLVLPKTLPSYTISLPGTFSLLNGSKSGSTLNTFSGNLNSSTKIYRTHSLTFNANSGNVSPTSQTVIYGKKYTNLPTPTRDGYTFCGWYTSLNGTNCINFGRDYMYSSGSVSVHIEAYMSNWAEYYNKDMRLISCTDGGGYNIEPKNGDNKADIIQYSCYDGAANGYKVATSSKTFSGLSAGWHSFDLIFDISQKKLCGYLDREQIATSAEYKGTYIGYCPTNVLFLGAEADANATTPENGHYFNGSIGNFVVNNNATRLTNTDTKNSWMAPAQDITLYARWTANEYKITFDANKPSNMTSTITKDKNSIDVTYDSTVSKSGVAKATGWTFNGYYTAKSNGDQVFDKDGNIKKSVSGYTDSNGKWIKASDVTLYAQWTANKYNATFNANKPTNMSGTVTQTLNGGSSTTKDDDKPYDINNYFTYDSVPNTAKASVTGWTFNGYYTKASSGTQIYDKNGNIKKSVSGYTDSNGKWIKTGGETLYAQWTAITYNLNLDANTGTFSGTKNGLEYTFDSSTGILKLNGTMTNWIGSFITFYPTTINKGDTFNVSITKKTADNKFTTSGGCFNCDLRSNDSVNDDTKQYIGFGGGSQDLAYSKTSTDNFDRIGIWIWHGTSTSFNNAEYQITIKRNGSATTFKNITETIQTLTYDTPIKLSTTGFDRKYTVTYNYNYTGPTNESVLTSSAVFTGWNAMNNGGLYGAYTSSMADITTSSSIGKNDYIKNLTSTKDGSTILKAKWGAGSVTLPSPTRTGYTFNGWYKESACTTSAGAGDASYSTSSDVTLYAKWDIDTYTITYNLGGGTASGNNASYTIETPTFTLNNPSKTGWLFNGWTGSNGTTPQTTVTITKGSTGNKTYTANWLETWASVDNSGKLIHGVAPSGAGTEASPYQIASAENLAWYMYQVNFVSGKTGIRAVQTSDINLNDHAWYPIGTASKKFAGDYDGQGYMIKNIKTNSKINGGVTGLFGYASAGCTHNVYLVGGDIQGQTYAGGIVGDASGAAIITNNVVYGVKVSGGTIGGIVGNSANLTTNSSSPALNGGITFNIFCYDKNDSNVNGIVGKGSVSGSEVSNCLLKVNGTENKYSITTDEWRSVTNMFVSMLPKSSFFWIASW